MPLIEDFREKTQSIIFYVGSVVGLLVGIFLGFKWGGLGGVIVCAPICAIVGALIAAMIPDILAFIWVIFLFSAVIGGIVFIIRALWDVGKP